MKIKLLFVVVLMGLFFSGCAKYPKLQETSSLTDAALSGSTGRIVFMKNNNVGEAGIDGAEITANLLFGNSHDEAVTYKILEIIDGEFKPIEEFLYLRDNSPSFYIDVPAGKHRFAITRTRTDLFINHMFGKMSILDIDVLAGQTYPVIFGIGDLLTADFWPELLAYNYQLDDEDSIFIYNLRQLDISGREREKQIENYKISTIPFRIAANAIAWMEPSDGPSNDFVKWTKSNISGLNTDLDEVKPDQIMVEPFDVYNKNL